jgi:Fe-S cluster assembly protein SufB
MELSTYFRINQAGTGQFERTLLIADEGSYVSYLEGCTAPSRDENQLHAAVVELIALDDAEIKYSLQNWYPGNKEGKGGVFNFVTKEESVRKCKNLLDASRNWFCRNLEISICYIKGDNSVGEFYRLLLPITFNRPIPEQNDPFR